MRRRDGGFALLIVLWTLGLLSLLISQLAGSGRQAIRLAGSLRTQAELQAVADGALQEAGFHLAASGNAHWPANGVLREERQGGTRDGIMIRLRLSSEAGKINPGIASQELLAALMHTCSIDGPHATAIASALVAWRFPSAQGAYGIEAYRQAGRAYGPPGQPFESIGELGLVLGMTPELLTCLTPHLSLYRDTDPDPNAADPLVLRTLAETLGAPPPLTDAPVDESVVLVRAEAIGPDGARATRQAILRMDPRQPASADGAGGSAGDATVPFRILDWHR